MSWWTDLVDGVNTAGVALGVETPAQAGVGDVTSQSPVTSWLQSAGGDIASGIEAGIVALINDIWTVIYPALEIGAGLLIAFLAFGFIFQDQLMQLAPMVAAAA